MGIIGLKSLLWCQIILPFLSNETDELMPDIQQASNSSSSPIINAYEYYTQVFMEKTTYQQDSMTCSH